MTGCQAIQPAEELQGRQHATSLAFPTDPRHDTAVVDRDLDCVVAGHGCPPHGHIALA